MTVTFHTREQIGLRPARDNCMQLRSHDQQTGSKLGFTWHHVGDGGNLFHPDPQARLRGIQAYHMDTLGYCDIAYEGAFDADGNVYGLRDGIYVGAHAKSNNNTANVLTDGICFLEDSRGITSGALAGFEWWINLFEAILSRKPTTYAHRWWARSSGGTPTACPGDDWDRVVRFIGGNA